MSEIERAIAGDVGSKTLRLSRGVCLIDFRFFVFDAMPNIEFKRWLKPAGCKRGRSALNALISYNITTC
ncbi:hypothetical protein AXG89_41640 (plasmid) [Burkholderia sp. PAMC 26561]|nr:hypothetical protein AXG89_41640 [Burkholderia sp. PAMC 26561]